MGRDEYRSLIAYLPAPISADRRRISKNAEVFAIATDFYITEMYFHLSLLI